MGYYEFDTKESAEAYWNSLPLKIMRRRAAAGSLTSEITDAPDNINQARQARSLRARRIAKENTTQEGPQENAQWFTPGMSKYL
jgi:hypothetical protein